MENEWHLTQKFDEHVNVIPWDADSLIALTRKTLVDILIIRTPEIFHITSIKSNNSLIFFFKDSSFYKNIEMYIVSLLETTQETFPTPWDPYTPDIKGFVALEMSYWKQSCSLNI